MADELLAASYFIPANIENSGTIAQNILAQVAGMRQRDQLNQSLCWSPEDLELLAMFAIEAKNAVARLTTENELLQEEREQGYAAAKVEWERFLEAEAECKRLRASREQAIQDIEALPTFRVGKAGGLPEAVSRSAVLLILREAPTNG